MLLHDDKSLAALARLLVCVCVCSVRPVCLSAGVGAMPARAARVISSVWQETPHPGAGEEQPAHRRHLLPDVPHAGLHRDRVLRRHQQRTGDVICSQFTAGSLGKTGLSVCQDRMGVIVY